MPQHNARKPGRAWRPMICFHSLSATSAGTTPCFFSFFAPCLILIGGPNKTGPGGASRLSSAHVLYTQHPQKRQEWRPMICFHSLSAPLACTTPCVSSFAPCLILLDSGTSAEGPLQPADNQACDPGGWGHTGGGAWAGSHPCPRPLSSYGPELTCHTRWAHAHCSSLTWPRTL